MSAILSSIACALLGLAVGAALQRWGDGERKLHGHKAEDQPDQWGPVWEWEPPATITGGMSTEGPLKYRLHNSIAEQWGGW